MSVEPDPNDDQVSASARFRVHLAFVTSPNVGFQPCEALVEADSGGIGDRHVSTLCGRCWDTISRLSKLGGLAAATRSSGPGVSGNPSTGRPGATPPAGLRR